MEKMTEELCKVHTKLPQPPPEIEATLTVLSGKWKILILWQLIRRECRFNELRRAIKGVSQHMLTQQLRDLERHGIISRTVFPEVPPRVEYALTEHGESLKSVIRALAGWGHVHLKRQEVAAPPAGRTKSSQLSKL
jgi:DNA-binding HxlR family transcriptional regulator